MAYTLDAFCGEARATLKGEGAIADKVNAIAKRLQALLVEPAFVASAFSESDPPGKKTLFHDPETDFYVLAHVQDGGKKGTPHSHGESWAIYGTVTNITRMTEYERVNPESEEAATLRKTRVYDVGPGQTFGYPPGLIHSTEHPQKAWVVRVTGCDLDALPRYRFRKFRDTII